METLRQCSLNLGTSLGQPSIVRVLYATMGPLLLLHCASTYCSTPRLTKLLSSANSAFTLEHK